MLLLTTNHIGKDIMLLMGLITQFILEEYLDVHMQDLDLVLLME